MPTDTRKSIRRWLPWAAGGALLLWLVAPSHTQPPGDPKAPPPANSFDQVSPVLLGQKSFADMMKEDLAAKDGIMQRQKKLLEERYDLSPRPDPQVKMTRGKPIPVGPTARLGEGVTWESLAAMTPDEVRDKGVFPKGYLPLPHPNHPGGGMLFPQAEVKLLARLARFDLDFDIPEAFCPNSRRRCF